VVAPATAVEALVRYLARRIGAHNIIVTLYPGIVMTEALSHFQSLKQHRRKYNKIIKQIPTGGWQPQRI
jgi:NAD(P)-dependent dehydrogenase (short-subunit alcohol dehydrogenase family)